MTWLVLTVALAAAPKVGGSVVWKLEDTRKLSEQNAPRSLALQNQPHLDATQMQVTVLALEGGSPSKVRVTILAGPGRLKGMRFVFEKNYGRAMLSEPVLGEKPRSLPALEAAVATLFAEDPIITAADAGKACDVATSEAIAGAAGQLTARLVMQSPEEFEVVDATASCAKAKNTYSVAFALEGTLRDETFRLPFSGTVTVVPGAWRAGVALTSKVDLHLQKGSKRRARIEGTLTFKSAFGGK